MSWSVSTIGALAPEHQAEFERMREPVVKRIGTDAVVQSPAQAGGESEYVALLAGIARSAIRHERVVLSLPAVGPADQSHQLQLDHNVAGLEAV